MMAGGSPSTQAVVSIIVSALPAGFTSASFTLDFDTDPMKRQGAPYFYGMIPDDTSKRNIVLVCMMLQSALLLLVRSLAAAMLDEVNTKYFLLYTLIDHGAYWLYAFARNDAWSFLNVTGPGGMLACFFSRSLYKVIVDYTGLVQFRGPGIVGGVYFSLNMIMAFLVSFAAIYVYFEHFGEKAEGLTRGKAYKIAGSICGAWVLVTGLFLLLIKRKYVSTFTSTQTGNEWVQDLFLKGETDAVKIGIFVMNPRCWDSIRPQVRGWLAGNWDRWEAEKPVWFDDVFLASVDDDMMPAEALKRLRQKGSGERRRSSFAERMGAGSVRERMGSATVVPEVGGDIEAGGSSAGGSAALPAAPAAA
jgi:hypothetical protein